MSFFLSVRPALAATLLALLGACSGSRAPEQQASVAPSTGTEKPANAKTSSASAVPDLGAEQFWKKNADGKILVTADNFIRAESDAYMAAQAKDGAFGTIKHRRAPAPVEEQLVIRLNRDTIYSSALFDLDAGPVTLTLPESGKRFMSALVINEDHLNPAVFYGAGSHTLTREDVGTRYALVGIRTLADPNDPADLEAAHKLQDAISFSQPGGPGKFEVPAWDPVSQKKVRDSLLALSETLPDMRYAAGPDRAAVDPVRRLIAAASAWGLNPDKDAIYLNVFPEKNDGKTPYRLTVGDVPVDAFWSITVYTKDGYFQPNSLNAYSINSITGKRGDDGKVTIQFGDCAVSTLNCLPITPGWNYMVRLYRPQPQILNGSWTFPEALPAS